MTETEMWRSVHKIITDNDPEKIWQFIRVEASTQSGMSDVCYTNGKITGWIELKTLSCTPHTILNLSALQITMMQWDFLFKFPNTFILIAFERTPFPKPLLFSVGQLMELVNKKMNAMDSFKMIQKKWPDFHIDNTKYAEYLQHVLNNIGENL